MNATKKTQYTCAVMLIVTSIVMVAYQVFTIQDVANGLLIYIGQAFLLAGSIFGLDYYIDKIKGAKIEYAKNLPMWCQVVHEKNMGNDAYFLGARMVKDAEVLKRDFALNETVKHSIWLYALRFLPRYTKTFLRRCKIKLRGYRFE